LWTPSRLIARLGKEINNKNSYLYWAYKASAHSLIFWKQAFFFPHLSVLFNGCLFFNSFFIFMFNII